MKKIAFIIMTVVLSSCHRPIKKDDSLKNFIVANSKSDSGILYLNQFNKIAWDKLYIIGAYQGKEFFDKNLSEYSNEILDTDIEDNELAALFALYNKDELVNLTLIGRPYYFVNAIKLKKNKSDFFSKLNYYSKKEAIFTFKYYPEAKWKGFKPILANKK